MTSKGAIIDVGAWLRDLGLGQYEAAFRENEIDIDILPELTEPHLEKLGVPLGHRIRLLKAISNLGASERSAVAMAPAPELLPTAQTGPPIPEAVGERRHVTVMFCDLVDFDRHIAAKLAACNVATPFMWPRDPERSIPRLANWSATVSQKIV